VEEAITLGDRIALLNVGGVLEQIASPAELLDQPANSFVAGFIGRDRHLRRLSLLKVTDAAFEPPDGDSSLPQVDVNGDLRGALDRLLESGARALTVTDGDTVRGVLTLDAIFAVAS